MSRPSTSSRAYCWRVDGRDKPGHDDLLSRKSKASGRTGSYSRLEPRWLGAVGAALLVLFPISLALAQASAAPGAQPIVTGVLRWLPLVFSGFLFNLVVSVLSMALGTALGVALGLGLIARGAPMRVASLGAMQFFRNAPWLVLLFYAMFLIPYQVTLFGRSVPFPDWIKAVIGLALPVMANVAEIVRGGVLSIPAGHWESARGLAFTRTACRREPLQP